MADFKKRETAYKLRIGEILQGIPIIEETANEGIIKEKLRFLEIGSRQVIRVNIIANVIEKYNSEGEKRFGSITLDDATGQIKSKVFGEDLVKFDDANQGDTLIVIGLLRSYNKEVYILPEIVRKVDPRYLLVRKLELEAGKPKIQASLQPDGQTVLSTREEILKIIKSVEGSEGVDTEQIILKIKTADPESINSEIIKLIEDGTVYEPRPGRVRYLG